MNRDRGNREWIDEYMSLKQVNPNNPFTVPEGYFDSLNEQILSKIKLEELKKSIPETGFTTPENYFDELADNIHARINIEEALDKESNGFTVPEGYFESLHMQIQSRLVVEEALAAKPEGFEVPQNYFNELTENILNKTTKQQKSRGAIVRRLIMSGAFKYASAACLVLAIGGTILLNRGGTPRADHNNTFLHKSLAEISVDDIESYLQSHLDPNDTHALIDANKQVDATNLSRDLQQALDSTSQ